MKIFELLRNPLIKLIGVAIVLYFALFSNKENPDSLGNRWSFNQIKSDIKEVKSKSEFIINNVHMAQELAKEKNAEKQAMKENGSKIFIEDVDIGSGEEIIGCGDKVEISYGIYSKDEKQLKFIEKQIVVIGDKNNPLIEKNIIGMKQNASRNIKIPYGFISQDNALNEMLKFNASDLKYQITILSLTKNSNPQISCE